MNACVTSLRFPCLSGSLVSLLVRALPLLLLLPADVLAIGPWELVPMKIADAMLSPRQVIFENRAFLVHNPWAVLLEKDGSVSRLHVDKGISSRQVLWSGKPCSMVASDGRDLYALAAGMLHRWQQGQTWQPISMGLLVRSPVVSVWAGVSHYTDHVRRAALVQHEDGTVRIGTGSQFTRLGSLPPVRSFFYDGFNASFLTRDRHVLIYSVEADGRSAKLLHEQRIGGDPTKIIGGSFSTFQILDTSGELTAYNTHGGTLAAVTQIPATRGLRDIFPDGHETYDFDLLFEDGSIYWIGRDDTRLRARYLLGRVPKARFAASPKLDKNSGMILVTTDAGDAAGRARLPED